MNGILLTVDFEMSCPVEPAASKLIVETNATLDGWKEVPANNYVETGREIFPGGGGSRVLIRLADTVPTPEGKSFCRARWTFGS